ncbi:MAG TPA: N-acetylmuramoyl-L-alanine amidase [Prolixibacteraceae bacterium]|jgi:N-acetylmuramoyl-L-alanine amidase
MLLYIYHFLSRHRTYPIIIAAALIFSVNYSIAQDYIKIKAKKGDGIYTILKENGLPPNEYLDLFIELNKTKLGKGNALIADRMYRLPLKAKIDSVIQNPLLTPVNESIPVVKVSVPIVKEIVPVKKVYEIYGKDYNEITIKSKELAGTVYYLMSGHGGPDPGAVGFLGGHQLCEDEYAYDVTLRLARNLTERGATVYMIIRDPNDGIRDESFLTPDKDEVCFPDQSISISQVARLHQSTDAVNKLYGQNKGKFQRLVVIHVDSRNKEENIDVFFYHNKGSKAGEKLADILKETFGLRYAVHQPSRGYNGSVSERNLYVIKNSQPTSVFIELGNINHTRDQQRFIVSDNRQAVSNWLRDGLIEEHRKALIEHPAAKPKIKKPARKTARQKK